MRGSCLSGVVAGTAVALILALPLRALAQDTGTIENGQSAAPSGALPAEPPQFEAPPATPASVSPRPVVGLRPAVNDPAIASAQIVPLDRIVIPAGDDLPPIKELVQRAFANRSDLLAEQASIRTSEISALGTENGLLPQLQAFAGRTTTGASGAPRIVHGRNGDSTADPYFVGGIGNALGQVFRQNFPTENIGVFARVPVNNRLAQMLGYEPEDLSNNLIVQLAYDGLRRMHRYEHTVPPGHLKSTHAGLSHGRQLRHERAAVGARDRDRPQLARLHMRLR